MMKADIRFIVIVNDIRNFNVVRYQFREEFEAVRKIMRSKLGLCIAGFLFSFSMFCTGCSHDTRQTDERAEKMEIAEEELNSAEYTGDTLFMEESDAELAYDFSVIEEDKIKSRGTLDNADATLNNGAFCTVDRDYGSMLTLTGGSQKGSPYVSLPEGVLNKVTEFTVTMNVQITGKETIYYPFSFGGSNVRHFAVAVGTDKVVTSFQAALDAEEKSSEVAFARERTGQWIHIAAVVRNTPDNYYADTYVDGELAGSFCFDGYGISDLGTDREAVIGKPLRGAGYLEGNIADFRMYFHPMEADEIKTLYYESFERLQSSGFAERLGNALLGENTSFEQVIFDLKLPKRYEGYPVEWKVDTSNGAVRKNGKVVLSEKKKIAVVTAAYSGKTTEYTITVPAKKNKKKALLTIAADKISIPNSDHIEENIILPVQIKVGNKKVKIQWKSSDRSVVSDRNQGDVKRGFVTRKNTDRDIMMKATFSCGGESLSRRYPLHVMAKMENSRE